MNEFKISIDLAGLLNVSPMVEAGVFRTLSAAVERVTMAGAERWKEAVMKAPLWEGERRAYADAISWQMTGQFSGEIVCDYKFVEDIETGRPPYDMKRMLDTSMKVRVSKKGRRYLIIPFRHNTPGNGAMAQAMPKMVYADAKRLKASRITGEGHRVSGTGAWDIKTKAPYLVRQRKYSWGESLPSDQGNGRYAGMYRFETTTPGGKRSSSYLTFRVMAEGQPGWVIPARPGLFLAKGVVDGLQGPAQTIFSEAVKKDLAGD